MSITLPPQGTHFSDGVRVGPILGSQYVAGANVLAPSKPVSTPTDSKAPGIYITPMSLLDSVPFAVSSANVAALQTPAQAGYITLNSVSNAGITWLSSFAGTSGPTGAGIIMLDVARNITITGVNTSTAATFTIFGWDEYEQPMVESITTGTNVNTANGVKAWKYIQAIYASAGTTANISVGVGNVFGLPYFLGDANYLFTTQFNELVDVGTIVAGVMAPATATTGDVRGTYTPSGNADSTKRLTLNMYNASGDTRKYYSSTSGTIYLINNALTSTNASPLISVKAYGHGFTTGENVTIAGATTFQGLAIGAINITAPVTVVDYNTFTYNATANATGAGSGGGSAIQMTPGKGNLYQVPVGRFGVAQYTQSLF